MFNLFSRQHGLSRLAMASAIMAIAACGCSHEVLPTATIGDPTVFTTLHIMAADRAYSQDSKSIGNGDGYRLGISTLGHLQRYFGTVNADYDAKALRMDAFLDQTQRSQAFAFLLARQLQLQGQFNDSGLTNPTFAPSPTADASNAAPSILAGAPATSATAKSAADKKVADAQAKLKKLQTDLATAQATLQLQQIEIQKEIQVAGDAAAKKAAAEAQIDQIPATKKEATKEETDALAADQQKAAEQANIIAAANKRQADAKVNVAALTPQVADLTKQVAAAQTALDEAKKAAQPAAATNAIVAALASLAQPNDSPFDRLDRVNDWYMSYMTLILSAYGGDSRALDITSLKNVFKQSYNQELANLKSSQRDYLFIALTALGRLAKDNDNSAYVKNAMVRLKDIALCSLVDAKTWKAINSSMKKTRKAAKKGPTTSTSAANSVGGASSTDWANAAIEAAQPNENMIRGLGGAGNNHSSSEDPQKDKLEDTVVNPAATSLSLMKVVEQSTSAIESLQPEVNEYSKAKSLAAVPSSDEHCPPCDDTDPTHKYRLITLLIPVTINAGTRPNTLVGLKINIIRVKRHPDPTEWCRRLCSWLSFIFPCGGYPQPGDVRVLSLHPQRSYDLEDEQLTQSFRDALHLMAQAGFSKAAVNVDSSQDAKQEEASRFLSRVAKVGAWQDASQHSFGWTFAPSNMHVVTRPIGSQIWDFFTGQPDRKYEARASLESGGRLCSVTLLVKTNIDAIDLHVSNYLLDVERGKLNWNIKHYWKQGIDKKGQKVGGCVHIKLPPYDPLETYALTLPRP